MYNKIEYIQIYGAYGPLATHLDLLGKMHGALDVFCADRHDGKVRIAIVKHDKGGELLICDTRSLLSKLWALLESHWRLSWKPKLRRLR